MGAASRTTTRPRPTLPVRRRWRAPRGRLTARWALSPETRKSIPSSLVTAIGPSTPSCKRLTPLDRVPPRRPPSGCSDTPDGLIKESPLRQTTTAEAPKFRHVGQHPGGIESAPFMGRTYRAREGRRYRRPRPRQARQHLSHGLGLRPPADARDDLRLHGAGLAGRLRLLPHQHRRRRHLPGRRWQERHHVVRARLDGLDRQLQPGAGAAVPGDGRDPVAQRHGVPRDRRDRPADPGACRAACPSWP